MAFLIASEEQAIRRIFELFPELNEQQKEQIMLLGELYSQWNEKVNLISRKDIENLYLHHILHSFGIVQFIHFKPGTIIIDAGTGGGLPGIPLAIVFPNCKFVLVDSIAKKIRICQNITKALALNNVTCITSRLEKLSIQAHYVVSRAAMPLEVLVQYSRNLFLKEQRNALPNGIIALKGGNLTEELKPYRNRVELAELESFLGHDYFHQKYAVFLPTIKS